MRAGSWSQERQYFSALALSDNHITTNIGLYAARILLRPHDPFSATPSTARYKTCHLVELLHNLLGLIVSQEHVAIRSSNVNNLFAPDVGTHAGAGANSISTSR